MNATSVQVDFAHATAPAPVALKPLPPGAPPLAGAGRREFNPAPAGPPSGAGHNQKLVETLAASATYREYQKAFRDATGLPLTLRPVEGWQLAHQGDPRQNDFCALMSRSNHSCSACLQMQQQACDGANGVPCTTKCAFGINETALRVLVGQETVAFLQTGQVFFKPPTPQQTRSVLKQLAAWGLHPDPAAVTRCYEATPVVPQAEYTAQVRLLQFFADQLGALANQIMLQRENAEPEQITRARRFIEANFQEEISLTVVAQQAGMSSFYFCKTFKKVTGLNYTKYVTRVRVEKAMHLLLNPKYRISEIAYEVGFQSLAHFNRAFRTVACETPTEYRSHLSSN
jgi:AraC-like DNA-binding protein/ligand-binding sensor protein